MVNWFAKIVAPTVPTALHWLCNRSCNHNQINQHLLLIFLLWQAIVFSSIYYCCQKVSAKTFLLPFFLMCECRDAYQQISPSVDPTPSLSYVSNSALWRILPCFSFNAGILTNCWHKPRINSFVASKPPKFRDLKPWRCSKLSKASRSKLRVQKILVKDF